ncbi:MAG TPA: DNA-processing protein DprA, partial [Dehalococcoidia bacterium]
MADSRSDLKFWLAFHRIPGIGRARFSFLEGYFRSLSDAWAADRAELRLAGLDERTVSTIISHRPKIDPDAELERLGKLGIQAYTWNDPGYPARLREVYEAPPVLYVRGGLQPADEWSIAVVGTRRASAYGRQAAEHLAGDLARNSITVVSGLARGVDAVAHRAALAAGGRTVAVLACGLDMVYPPEHRQLAREIMEAGALVSDYPPGTQPRSDYFPRRNRIMSGMS